MIDHLDLRRPIYRPAAASARVGRLDVALAWERDDAADAVPAAARSA
jgi:S-adenosylmethionine synthetase